MRYSAPSLVFEREDGRRLEAGGFQSIEAYDVLIANLDPTLDRRPPAEDPLDALRAFPGGLVTAEVAAIMTHNNMPVDIAGGRAGADRTASGTARSGAPPSATARSGTPPEPRGEIACARWR